MDKHGGASRVEFFIYYIHKIFLAGWKQNLKKGCLFDIEITLVSLMNEIEWTGCKIFKKNKQGYFLIRKFRVSEKPWKMCKKFKNNQLVHDIGTSKIFELEPSKSFVMIFFGWLKVGLINPESRNLF